MGAQGKRVMHAHLVDATPEVQAHQRFGRVAEIRGKAIVAVFVADRQNSAEQPASAAGEQASLGWSISPGLSTLPPKFRNVLYLRRGAYVLLGPLDTAADDAKVAWTIEAVLRPEDMRLYIRDGCWPLPWMPAHRVSAPAVSSEPSDSEASETCDDSNS